MTEDISGFSPCLQQILAFVPPLLLHPLTDTVLHLEEGRRWHRLSQQRLQRAGHLPHNRHRHLGVWPSRYLRESCSCRSHLVYILEGIAIPHQTKHWTNCEHWPLVVGCRVAPSEERLSSIFDLILPPAACVDLNHWCVSQIEWGACALVLTGNVVIFGTILGFFLVFGSNDDFSWQQW